VSGVILLSFSVFPLIWAFIQQGILGHNGLTVLTGYLGKGYFGTAKRDSYNNLMCPFNLGLTGEILQVNLSALDFGRIWI